MKVILKTIGGLVICMGVYIVSQSCISTMIIGSGLVLTYLAGEGEDD